MEIRKIQIEDAKNLLNLLKKLDTETTFLLYEKEERKITTAKKKHTRAARKRSLNFCT